MNVTVTCIIFILYKAKPKTTQKHKQNVDRHPKTKYTNIHRDINSYLIAIAKQNHIQKHCTKKQE